MKERILSAFRGELPECALDRLLAIAEGPYASANGIEPVLISRDEVRLRMPMEGKHNSRGVGHGAATFLLADQTFAYASNMDQEVQVALSCHISFLKPVRGDVLTSVSRRLHEGRSTSLFEISIYDGEELVAVMMGTGHRIKG